MPDSYERFRRPAPLGELDIHGLQDGVGRLRRAEEVYAAEVVRLKDEEAGFLLISRLGLVSGLITMSYSFGFRAGIVLVDVDRVAGFDQASEMVSAAVIVSGLGLTAMAASVGFVGGRYYEEKLSYIRGLFGEQLERESSEDGE